MEKRKRIYLACPYTHENAEVMEYRAKIATAMASFYMRVHEYIVFSPITYGHEVCKHGFGHGFGWWKEMNLSIIKEWATEVHCINLAGYENSVGMKAEIAFAEENKIPVIEIDHDVVAMIIRRACRG